MDHSKLQKRQEQEKVAEETTKATIIATTTGEAVVAIDTEAVKVIQKTGDAIAITTTGHSQAIRAATHNGASSNNAASIRNMQLHQVPTCDLITPFSDNFTGGSRTPEDSDNSDGFDARSSSFWSVLASSLAVLAAVIFSNGSLGPQGRPHPFPQVTYTMQEETEDVRLEGGGTPRQSSSGDATERRDIQNNKEGHRDIVNLHSAQEGQQQAQASDQLEVDQQPHLQATLQNDDNERRQGSDQQGGLHGENRLNGLFLGTTSGSGTSAFPFLPLERNELLVQMPTLRPSNQPILHNQALQASGGLSSVAGTSRLNIHRRFAN